MTTISCKPILGSIGPNGQKVATLEWRYPRVIHAEVMTHRMLSRNASSSRAIPVKKLIEEAENDPFVPLHWGKNQPGMQSKSENEPTTQMFEDGGWTEPDSYWTFVCEDQWLKARNDAVKAAKLFDAAGYHKQLVNRLLEPFTHITVVVTATNFSNFLALRDHPDAEPHIRILAQRVRETLATMEFQKLGYGEWHLPYVTEEDRLSLRPTKEAGLVLLVPKVKKILCKVSAARCARVSYLNHDGTTPNIEADLALYDRLVRPGQPVHASPLEHQCSPDLEQPHLHGNLAGFIQFRKTVENESVPGFM